MSTITFTGKLVVVECYQCYMRFAIPRDFYDRLQELRNQGRFTCPSCECRQHYIGKSTETKLREQLDREKNNSQRLSDRLDLEREDHKRTEYQRRAAKGQLTKTKKRIGAGVCPCCNRTFQDLARHMTGQHPDYAEPTP